jgi:hypothetical protein
MIGNALDAILDALDRHISGNEPPSPPSSKPRNENEDNPPAPPVSQTPAAAPASPPPEEPDERGEDRAPNPTIRPSPEDIERLVEEHSDKKGLPLTRKAAERVIEETQPEGTKAVIVGKNVPGPDIIYEDASRMRVGTVEVRTAKNVDRAEDAVRTALDKRDSPSIVALQVPSGTDVPRMMGKLRNFDVRRTIGKAILAVDRDGNVLIPLQPLP